MADASGPIIILFVVAALLVLFSAFAAAHRRVPGAGEFGHLMAASSIYAVGYGLELCQKDLGAMTSVIRFEYIGIATLPAFWLLFALRFAGCARPKPGFLAALFAVPLVVLAALWSNNAHHLYYARTWVNADGAFPVFGFERGPFYWINFSFLQICSLAGNFVLIRYALRAPQFLRRQALMAAIGSMGPWLGNAIYLMGWVPWGMDPSAFFLSIAGIFFSLAIFRLGFLELVPAARDRAIESLRDGFLVVDSGGHIIDANEASGRLLGDWARTGGILRANEPGGRELARILEQGEAEIEFSLAVPEGEERRLAAQAFPVMVGRYAKKGSGIMIRDITETTALLARLGELAGTDELTGLANRRRFFEYSFRQLSIAIREARPLSVAILDIDHFKNFNDRFGHAVGDRALREFSLRLARSLREADILCRYGGEEFAILLPGADAEAAFGAIERVRRLASGAVIHSTEGDMEIRASAGVYSAVPGKDSSLDGFLEEADKALYEAKMRGRDQTVLSTKALDIG
jgi:diguanylate cyclase (GGDEF)-like protein